MSDLVSRESVLRCIKASREDIDWGQSDDGDAFLHYSAALYRTIACPECLPSAEPKKGKWMEMIEVNELGEPYQSGVYCSECGHTDCYEPNYCPNCGADMKEEE